ncbi:MAG TPA: hypothetical protein VNE61_16675 [Ktedonobacteraceae bacterium]|nr:hypothetical protein [Ktedonobacteraceae bacterium]
MKRNRLFCIVLMATIALSACASTPPQPPPNVTSSPEPQGMITIGQPVRALPTAFLGFNLELSSVCSMLAQDAADTASYEHLYTAIAPGILHIGGHSADLSTWSASGSFACSASHSVITDALITSVFAFARRVHWRVIWTLPLLAYNPTNAAHEAVAIARSGGTSLLAFAIGNEPELYAKRFGARAASWDSTNYLSEWQDEERAVVAAVPQAAISGPDTCCSTDFYPSFAQAAGANQVTLLTHHFYTRSSSGSPPTIDQLLSMTTYTQFTGELQGWLQTARSVGLPLALTEVNSISNGGAPGVSNTAAATFWLASLCFAAAAQGVSFVAIQEALHASYNVIEDDGQPSILYTALQLVHQIVANSQLIAVSGSFPASLQILATRHIDGSIQVVLINHDAQQALSVSVAAPKGTAAQTLTMLTAPNLSATSHAQLATQTWIGKMPVQVNPESLIVLTYR